MKVSPLAGKPADPALLVNVPKLITAYFTDKPDAAVPGQRVEFGTSGHRGSAFDISFNEWHILAISSGHMSIPKTAQNRWPAVPRHGYTCALGTGAGQCIGSAGRQ